MYTLPTTQTTPEALRAPRIYRASDDDGTAHPTPAGDDKDDEKLYPPKPNAAKPTPPKANPPAPNPPKKH